MKKEFKHNLCSSEITNTKRRIISLDANGVPDGRTPSRRAINAFYAQTANQGNHANT